MSIILNGPNGPQKLLESLRPILTRGTKGLVRVPYMKHFTLARRKELGILRLARVSQPINGGQNYKAEVYL